jgi:subtilisin family serine protease
VIAVGSTDPQDIASDFSTRGAWISVCAPGSQIFSTFPNGLYKTMSGTSMATPQVTGLFSLIKSVHDTWAPDMIRTQIEGTADDLGTSGFDYTYGYGRINANSAVRSNLLNKYGVVDVTVNLGGFATSGINVVLRDNSGNTVATTLTNSNGHAVFYDILEGNYNASANGGGTTASVNISITAGHITNATINL